MSKVLITGSSTGLGLLAAQKLIRSGHQVVLHARNQLKAHQLRQQVTDAAAVLVGDLTDISAVRQLAEQANQLLQFDAVIHNAGIYPNSDQVPLNADGLNQVFAVNVLAPYLLSLQLLPPKRMIFLSSSMHASGQHDVTDINWQTRRWHNAAAYSESKFYLTLLAQAFARLRPNCLCNSVDPGWVPTRMGGASASDDLQLGCETQAWLAVSDDAAAQVSGKYFFHRQQQPPHPATQDVSLQQKLLALLAELSGKTIDARD